MQSMIRIVPWLSRSLIIRKLCVEYRYDEVKQPPISLCVSIPTVFTIAALGQVQPLGGETCVPFERLLDQYLFASYLTL